VGLAKFGWRSLDQSERNADWAPTVWRSPHSHPGYRVARDSHRGLRRQRNDGRHDLDVARIGLGNMLEGVLGAIWSTLVWGTRDFACRAGRLIAVLAFLRLRSAPYRGREPRARGVRRIANVAAIWLTWWLGDLAGALVITP